jgi:hypothetical protein
MPYYARLVTLLMAAPHRVNAAGEIELTHAEAEHAWLARGSATQRRRSAKSALLAQGDSRILASRLLRRPAWSSLKILLVKAISQAYPAVQIRQQRLHAAQFRSAEIVHVLGESRNSY